MRGSDYFSIQGNRRIRRCLDIVISFTVKNCSMVRFDILLLDYYVEIWMASYFNFFNQGNIYECR